MMGVQVMVTDPRVEYDEVSGNVREVEEIEVAEIVSGGLAEKHGMLAGDRIRSVTFHDETLVFTRQYQLIDFMLSLSVGDKYVTTVDRLNADGEYESHDIEIIITEECITTVE